MIVRYATCRLVTGRSIVRPPCVVERTIYVPQCPAGSGSDVSYCRHVAIPVGETTVLICRLRAVAQIAESLDSTDGVHVDNAVARLDRAP